MEPTTERKQVKELSPGEKLWYDNQEWTFERDWLRGKELQHFRSRAGQRVEMSGEDWVDKIVSPTSNQPEPQKKNRGPWWRFWE